MSSEWDQDDVYDEEDDNYYFDEQGNWHVYEDDDYLIDIEDHLDVSTDDNSKAHTEIYYNNDSIQDIISTDPLVNAIKKTENDLTKIEKHYNL